MQELLALLQDAGHIDFRDARGPMGFTQRQAGGKCTHDEAEAFIAQLLEAQEAGPAGDPPPAAPPPVRLTSADHALRKVPSHKLAAELQRRGWVVMEP